MTSRICGRNTIAILWGNTFVLCVVKRWRFVALFEQVPQLSQRYRATP